MSDRHRGKRNYLSGSAKRKAASEKEKKEKKVISDTRRVSEFFKPKNDVQSSASANLENSVNCSDKITVDKGHKDITYTSVNDENCSLNMALPTEPTEQTQRENQEDCVQNEEDKGLSSDIGLWPHEMKQYVKYWVNNYSPKIHCNDSKLIAKTSFEQKDGKKMRKCTINVFQRKTKLGEIVERTWVCFSPTTGGLYCFFCKLFDKSNDNQFTREGFHDWKHSNERLVSHETSSAHLKALIDFHNLSKEHGHIDEELEKQIKYSTQYWRKVLTRVIDVILFLSERALPFRGNNEKLGSPNNGNFLGVIELLAKYDNFLAEHLQLYGNCGSGNVNYLSSTIYEELIEEIGKCVFEEIIKRLKKAKIYSISLDGTSDEGHIDQLTIIVRYVEGEYPVERFVKFLPNQGHKAQEMFDGLTNFLKENKISINDCRGQSYDNASPMSGKYNGLQALVKQENDLAIWVPCLGHSLNLTGEKASNASSSSTIYFMFLQNLFVFFSASDKRWALLVTALKKDVTNSKILVPQRVECTRWSSRADANKALVKGFIPIRRVLLEISENSDFESKTRCEAQGCYKKMCQLETGILATFWNDILENLNKTSNTVQNSQMQLNTAIACVKSLKNFIVEKRYAFDHYERLGSELTQVTDYKSDRKWQRNVRLNPLDYANTPDLKLIPSENFRIFEFIPIIDTFVVALDQRISAYEESELRFGFLSRFDKLSEKEITEVCARLINIYKDDFDYNLEMEMLQFQQFCKELLEFDTKKKISREQAMYSLIIQKGVCDAFPNVEILLRIYLTLMITNCSGERSFSKLKIIKNSLRTLMSQDRLNYLNIMSTERDVMREIEYEEIIRRFSEKKARKQFI